MMFAQLSEVCDKHDVTHHFCSPLATPTINDSPDPALILHTAQASPHMPLSSRQCENNHHDMTANIPCVCHLAGPSTALLFTAIHNIQCPFLYHRWSL